MAGLTIGKAKSAGTNLSLGSSGNTNLSLGTNGGMQPTAPAWNVKLGAGGINQTPVGPAYVLGSGVSTGGGGGGGVTQPAAAPAGPSQQQLNPLLAALASLDTILANRNAQSQDEYGRAIAGYDSQDALDKRAFDENTQQNEQTLTSNNQRALLNAANSSSGLQSVLASLGGLAGSGVDVVKRLVGLAANSDTGAARETFDTNSGNLNTAWSRAEQQQRQRRQDADATLRNNRMNNEAGVLSSRQSIYEQLANMFGAGNPQGMDYASKASALAAPIAATTRATVAPYQAPSSSFSPGALQSYLAGTQNLQVNTAGGGGTSTTPVNSPLFALSKKKDQLAGVA